jgi:hypothetical protein
VAEVERDQEAPALTFPEIDEQGTLGDERPVTADGERRLGAPQGN